MFKKNLINELIINTDKKTFKQTYANTLKK